MHSILLAASLLSPAPAQDGPPTADTPPIPADTEIVTTESGLQYSVLSKGTSGDSPSIGDRVRVHYTGWLENGTMFDSSRQRGEPTEFGLGHVIEGWDEGLALMSVGDRFKFTLTAALGYGESGTPDGAIPPGATLVFDVELLGITARTLPAIAWPGDDAEGVTKSESGVSFRTMTAGGGAKVLGSKVIVVRFSFRDAEGTVLQSDAMMGRPLLADPAQMPFPFMAELAPSLSEGTHVHFHAPTTAMPGMGFDDIPEVFGQIQVDTVMDFAKPEFSMPADEELTTTDSGLKYKILKKGGPYHPTRNAQVAAHYAGWLTDGTQFDASYDSGQPLQSSLRGLIAGWQEGMCLVGHGGVVVLVVPPELGYGAVDKGTIPPNSTLVFVVELIDFRG